VLTLSVQRVPRPRVLEIQQKRPVGSLPPSKPHRPAWGRGMCSVCPVDSTCGAIARLGRGQARVSEPVQKPNGSGQTVACLPFWGRFGHPHRRAQRSSANLRRSHRTKYRTAGGRDRKCREWPYPVLLSTTSCCVHPRRGQRLLSGGGEFAFANRWPGLNCLPRKMRRRAGPERAGHFSLRAEVDCTDASKSATPRPADYRESVDSSGTPRISCRAGCVDIEPRNAVMPARSTASVRSTMSFSESTLDPLPTPLLFPRITWQACPRA
jgi:hypothetical protein